MINMKVKVQLYAILAKYLPSNAENKTAILELAEGTTVKGILEELKIPEAMPKILLVNGRNVELDKVVVEGDTISVFPPIAGGERKWGQVLIYHFLWSKIVERWAVPENLTLCSGVLAGEASPALLQKSTLRMSLKSSGNLMAELL